MTKARCENPNCGVLVSNLRVVDIGDHGLLSVCENCRYYAKTHNKLRPKILVARLANRKEHGSNCFNKNCPSTGISNGKFSKYNGEYYCKACGQYTNEHGGKERSKELIERRRRTKLAGRGECENPACKRDVTRLRRFVFGEQGAYRICDSCHSHATKYHKLRTAEMVKQAAALRAGRKPKGDYCFNANCRSKELFLGGYGRANGEFYCELCAKYVNKYGVERSREQVEESAWRLESCQNPSCRKKTWSLSKKTREGLRICGVCEVYYARNKRMRSVEVTRNELRKKLKKGEVEDVCYNANCRTTDMRRAGYAKCNGKRYCHECCCYIDSHGGEERPKKLADKRKLRHSRYMWLKKHPWEEKKKVPPSP